MSPASASGDSLPDAVGRRIRSRVGRRVHNVVVLHDHKSLVVRGHATSYHAWQLVIAECQAALAEASGVRLDCILRVEPAPYLKPRGNMSVGART
jgi:hypothetical protein